MYFNQDEEVYEYWKQVEQGNVPTTFGERDAEDEYDEDYLDEEESQKKSARES